MATKIRDLLGRALCRLEIHDYDEPERLVLSGVHTSAGRKMCKRCGYWTLIDMFPRPKPAETVCEGKQAAKEVMAIYPEIESMTNHAGTAYILRDLINKTREMNAKLDEAIAARRCNQTPPSYR